MSDPLFDFTEDSIFKRLRAAHYHVRIAQDIAYGHFGGDMAPLRVRLALNKAQAVLIRLVNRLGKGR